MITFTPLVESHLPLMHRWLNEGEALRWYGRRPINEESIRRKYLVMKPQTGTRCLIILHDREPIGYLQHYRIGDYPEYCLQVGGGSHDHGLDLFIGCRERIGLGIGTRIVVTALADLIFSQNGAQRCLLGPSPDNKRAIRCYEKCGFRYIRTVTAPDGEKEYLMVVERTGGGAPPAGSPGTTSPGTAPP
jgi:RimJ/RimL family protein N-acetyltransferase